MNDRVHGALSVVSAQLNCYDCSYVYIDGENMVDFFNCSMNPPSTINSQQCTSSSDVCYVESTYSASSIIIGGDNEITFTRGCTDEALCKTDCSKDPSCRKCCMENNCNDETLMSHLNDNALSQTCYRCQYSEVPGTPSDAGCGLTFDASSSEVYEVECPGLCYSARTKFEGVEEVFRGCLQNGQQCSYDGVTSLYTGQPGSIVSTTRFNYDLACCTGQRCNTATTLSVGIVSVLLSTLLGVIVTLL